VDECKPLFAGTLTLQTSNHESNAYALKGVAEEPLSENHVVIKCQARKKADHRFTAGAHTRSRQSST
jgi:hypothetical protein